MTIEANLLRAHGMLTTLSDGRHTWTADVTKELGSLDAAPDPHALLDSALAACTAITVEMYARRKNMNVTELRVSIDRTESRGADGRVDYVMKRTVHIDGALTEDERLRLFEIANKCPIHRILTGRIEVQSELAP
jgi:putative redox protein